MPDARHASTRYCAHGMRHDTQRMPARRYARMQARNSYVRPRSHVAHTGPAQDVQPSRRSPDRHACTAPQHQACEAGTHEKSRSRLEYPRLEEHGERGHKVWDAGEQKVP